jgi:hypothetical protein
MLSRRTFINSTAALMLLAALPLQAHGTAEIMVEDAYARTMGGIGASGAVFMVLANHGHHDDRLIGAKTDAAAKAELHTHVMTADGVMQMREIEGGVPLPAGVAHEFVRGADHVMLLGLTRALKDGDTLSLTLIFESGAEVTVDVVVDNQRKPGEGGMKMEGHDHGAMGG